MENINSYSRGLIDAAAKGNLSAVTAIFNLSYEYVYRSLKVMISDENVIMDVAQDAYIRAFTNLVNLADPNKFPDLVRSLAVPDAKIMLIRKNPKLFSETADSGENIDFQDDRGSAIPDSVIDSSETLGLLEELLSDLTPEQRLITALFYYEKLSTGEISSKLNISENAVKSWIISSREAIKKIVDTLSDRGANLYGMTPTQLLRITMKSFEVQPIKPPFKAATFETIRFGLGAQFFSQKPPVVKTEDKKDNNPSVINNNQSKDAEKDVTNHKPINNLQDVFSTSSEADKKIKPLTPVEFEDPDDYEIKKNKKHLLTVVIFVILLISLAAGIAGALMLYQHQNSTSSSAATKTDINVSSQVESSSESQKASSNSSSSDEIEITVAATESASSIPIVITESSTEASSKASKEESSEASSESSAESDASSESSAESSEAESSEESSEVSSSSTVPSSDISLLKDWNSDYHRSSDEWVCFGFNGDGTYEVVWFMNDINSTSIKGTVVDGAIECDFSGYADGAKAYIYVQDNSIQVICNSEFANTGLGSLDGTYTIQ